ncbi:MAG TPA: hypothetical protein VJO33_00835 [Gemmatimonadaceae bacterium]|nr:hypothetical protein [Gemmatimonadaceae bacterium]
MDFTLTYRGIPIGIAVTQDARGLAVIATRPLAALEAIRAELPQWVRTGVTAIGARGFSDALEWRDRLGAAIPAARIDVWLTDDGELLVFTAFDALAVGVPAVVPQRGRSNSNEADG